MLNLHVPPTVARFSRLFKDSDHTAWAVLALAVASAAAICAVFLLK
jgi:hypothetical protein